MSGLTDMQIAKLAREELKTAAELGIHEARFLVDTYYAMQKDRIREANRQRELSEAGEPHLLMQWLADQNRAIEDQIKKVLDRFSDGHELGRRVRIVTGIGPVIAAGLLAYIDLHKAPTAGAIWRYAGLDPTLTWNKGEKRPWNASLKVLCWKIGTSFVKTSGSPKSFYGPIYMRRKEYEIERNEAGLYRQQAEESLKKHNFGADTQARKYYEQGKLPPARIHLRAMRYTVKLFLAHYHEVGRRLEGLPVPNPYVMDHLGHAHKIELPF